MLRWFDGNKRTLLWKYKVLYFMMEITELYWFDGNKRTLTKKFDDLGFHMMCLIVKNTKQLQSKLNYS